MMNKPLLIVLSCTRNYGWVTRAFLEGNTRWADYIIIVDQMSTDGTREMCAEYGEKVILVDDKDMNYKESTRAIMAFNKGREIAGNRDHIFFALDIDEVMPANWMQTGDGQKILNSKPQDEFSLHWANLNPDNKTYFEDGTTTPWQVQYKVFHDDLSKEFKETGLQIHSPLLPYMNFDVPPYEVKDFLLLHFGFYYEEWIYLKNTYYSFLIRHQKRGKRFVRACRNFPRKKDVMPNFELKPEWLFKDFDLFGCINTDQSPIFIDYINELIEQDGIGKFCWLDIWSSQFLSLMNMSDPRRWYHKCLHAYFHWTYKYWDDNKFLHGMDRIIEEILKPICKLGKIPY